jgi:hypothetical protein
LLRHVGSGRDFKKLADRLRRKKGELRGRALTNTTGRVLRAGQ